MAASKRKITQDELRRLMNEQKKKCLSNNIKKIESPLAKYDKNGTLHCVLCETVVRSEAVWSVHINSKNHKQNILNKVKKKEEVSQSLSPSISHSVPKKPSTSEVPQKKIKGILKNSNLSTTSKELREGSTENKSIQFNSKSSTDDDENIVECGNSREKEKQHNDIVLEKDIQDKNDLSEVLPEGFFDDPKLDAKFRNVEYKDPIEEEWELFQKEIKEETSKAQQIIAEDQEEATAERQINEIDEQIRNWSRVVTLEKKKETVNVMNSERRTENKEGESSENEEEFEEFLDWRSKKS